MTVAAMLACATPAMAQAPMLPFQQPYHNAPQFQPPQSPVYQPMPMYQPPPRAITCQQIGTFTYCN